MQNINNALSRSELIGTKMMGLLNHPQAGRLQATVIAMACMGVYSKPYDKLIDCDMLIMTRDLIEVKGCFPLLTLKDCISAFDAALILYNKTTNDAAKLASGRE